MAVIAAEAIAALAITGATVVIPAAAAGVALLVANSKLGHVDTVVEDCLELTAGTHISYKFKDGAIDKFSYRHAIVAEDVVAKNGQPIKLIYWFDGRVICEDVLLTVGGTGTGSCPVYRHDYNCSISNGRETVAARARSLSSEYVRPERYGVITSYWQCFDDDKDFAVWCHTGVHFTRILHGMFSTDFKYIKVSSISCLRPGDHISFRSRGSKSYQHGIVVDLDGLENTITVTCKTTDTSWPHSVILQGSDFFGSNSSNKLYRYDYDIAIGYCGELAVRNALNETRPETRCNGPPLYQSDVDFAVWCKLSVVVSPNDASTLAKARVASCLHATVRSKTDLRRGDHIEFGGQHLIVDEVITATQSGTQMVAIFMPNVEPGTGSGKKITQKTFDNMDNAIGRKQLVKYFYDIAEANIDESAVVKRAKQHLGEDVDDLPFKDSQHFAMWCRTGAIQLHAVRSEDSRVILSRDSHNRRRDDREPDNKTDPRQPSDGSTVPVQGLHPRQSAGVGRLDPDDEVIVLNNDEDDDEDQELFRQNLRRQFDRFL